MSIDLKEMRDRKQFADAEWKDVFDEGDEDLRYLSGHPFSPDEEELWATMYGPKPIAADQLSSHVNRVSNHVLAKPRGIKVHQATQRATTVTASDRNDIIRGVEYTGGAQVAMLMAYRSMIETSYGVLGMGKRYKPGSRHMELFYRPFANRRQVVVDPTIVQPDGSDMQYGFVGSLKSKKAFERKYGKDAKSSAVGLGMDEMGQASQWFQNMSGVEYVVECEYWNIEQRKQRLFYLDLANGTQIDLAESVLIKEGMGWRGDILMRPDGFGGWEPYAMLSTVEPSDNPYRDEEVPEVTQYITNGYDILDTIPWDTHQIPLILMLGKQLFITQGGVMRREVLSLIRLARQPYKALCYVRSKQLLLAGMAPLTPFMVGEGQLSAAELDKLSNAHRIITGAIQYKLQMDNIVNPDGSKPLLPPPQRVPHNIGSIDELEILAAGFIRDCSTAMGFANIPSAMLQDKQKSGRALEEITEMVDQGSSHFIDTYDKAGKQCGVIINEEIDFLANGVRDFVAITPDKQEHVLTVGREAMDPRSKQVRTIDLGLSEDHDVTISVGPTENSVQEEADKFLEQVTGGGALELAFQGNQLAMEVVGRTLRSRDLGAPMDAIADLFSPKDKESSEAKLQQCAQQLQMAMAKLQQDGIYIQKLEERMRQLESGIEKQVVADSGAAEREWIKGELALQKQALVEANKAAAEARSADMLAFKAWIDESRANSDHARNTEMLVAEHALQPEPVAEGANG